MIFGVGTDIAQVPRFERWVRNPKIIEKYFNQNEFFDGDLQKSEKAACRHYAVRFAAKEAFAKALGTGFIGLTLRDFYVAKDKLGKPYFKFGEETKKILDSRLGNNYNIQLSMSHEKEYAVAFVVIEKGDN